MNNIESDDAWRDGFAGVMVDHIVPPYRALMESYDKAQNVQKVGHETKLDLLVATQSKK
ncbi:MAG: hypothetical protein ABIU85_11010 [Methylotenera sp.]